MTRASGSGGDANGKALRGDGATGSVVGDRARRREPGDLEAIRGVPFVCSWSGGKDSCLALQRAVAAGGEVRALLCMLHEDGQRTRSHGLPMAFLRAQATALGVPVVLRASTWDDYEAVFRTALRELADAGVEAAVFGDIDIEDHLEWERRVAGEAGLRAFLPLWGSSRRALLDEVFAAPIEALIVTTRAVALGESFVGRGLTPAVVAEIEAAGADGCGENGEYHTAVLDCPLFQRRVGLRVVRTVAIDDYRQAELELVGRGVGDETGRGVGGGVDDGAAVTDEDVGDGTP